MIILEYNYLTLQIYMITYFVKYITCEILFPINFILYFNFIEKKKWVLLFPIFKIIQISYEWQ